MVYDRKRLPINLQNHGGNGSDKSSAAQSLASSSSADGDRRGGSTGRAASRATAAGHAASASSSAGDDGQRRGVARLGGDGLAGDDVLSGRSRRAALAHDGGVGLDSAGGYRGWG